MPMTCSLSPLGLLHTSYVKPDGFQVALVKDTMTLMPTGQLRAAHKVKSNQVFAGCARFAAAGESFVAKVRGRHFIVRLQFIGMQSYVRHAI